MLQGKLTVGDPVVVRKVTLKGVTLEVEWIPATVCLREREDGVIGVAFADGSRLMVEPRDYEKKV